MKFKVIETEMPDFENELNNFVSIKGIEIIDIKYSTAGFPPDTEYGWHSAIFHSALISYRESK